MNARILGTERVFLGIGHDFFGDGLKLDFNAIIDEVAVNVVSYNGETLYSKDKNGNLVVFRRRTKKCILKETNKLIDGLGEGLADESARSRVSKKQIDRLVNAFKNKGGRITCYALVILHVCYMLILDHAPDRERQENQLPEYAEALRKMTEAYYAVKEDALAHFLIKCYPPLIDELHNPLHRKDVEDFPPIPKRAPMEPANEQRLDINA